MNRKRCPWCGKITDKTKDKNHFSWKKFPTNNRPIRLYSGECSHCKNKYGQYPNSHNLIIADIAVLFFVFSLVFQWGVLFDIAVLALILCISMYIFTPYAKLNENHVPCEGNAELLCKFEIIELHGKIKYHELYYLDDCFDNFQPFVLASPIQIYYAPRKSNMVLGEFLYMHEKNYDYINKDSCELFDTDMILVARIRFIKDDETKA